MDDTGKTSQKPIWWIGSSLRDLKDMPEEVQRDVGHALRDIQRGRDPGNTKSLKHLKEPGIREIVVDEREGTFRTAYTVEFRELIAVLHVFQKKSKTGIETPRKEIDLVLERMKSAKVRYQEWKKIK